MLLKIQEETGVVPKALQNRPTLAEHLKHGWAVFSELNAQRLPGYAAPSALQLSQLLGLANLWQWSRRETQDTWELVSLIDRLWLREVEKRQAAADAKKKRK